MTTSDDHRILCVDDEPNFLEALARQLSEVAEVVTVASGAEAIAAVEARGPFAAVVADMQMPSMDGVSLLAIIRRIAPETVRILFTGHPNVEVAVGAVNSGQIFRFLTKPSPADTVVQAARDALEQYKRNVATRGSQPHDTGLQKALMAAPDAILVVDKTGNALFHNQVAEGLFGVGADALTDCIVGIPVADETGEHLIETLSGRTAQMRVAAILWRGTPSWLVILRDVTAQLRVTKELDVAKGRLEEANKELYETSITDELTGLLNRRGFESELWKEISRCRRYGGALTAVLFDCDRFKEVNTTYGHVGGDAALKQVAKMMKQKTRATDAVSRIGGDEFLVLLPETREAEGLVVADKIRQSVSNNPAVTAMGTIQASVSAGVATVPRDVSTIEGILQILKDALAHSKQAGRNMVVTSDQASGELSAADSMLADDFFDVFEQPIAELSSKEVVGYECFCSGKAESPEWPARKFSLTGLAGRLPEIDLHCLSLCIRRIEIGCPGNHHLNVSPKTLTEHSGQILELLSGVADLTFCLELSEDAFVGDVNALQVGFELLRRQGVRLALGDISFGSRSLEAIISLEPDFLRVSKGFSGSPEEGYNKRRNWSRLVTLAQAVSAKVVVDGVDTQDDAQLLEGLGLDYGQGLYFGAPKKIG